MSSSSRAPISDSGNAGMAPRPLRTWNLIRNPGAGLLFSAGAKLVSPPVWHWLQCRMKACSPRAISGVAARKGPLTGSPRLAEEHAASRTRKVATEKDTARAFICSPIPRNAPEHTGALARLRSALAHGHHAEIDDVERAT